MISSDIFVKPFSSSLPSFFFTIPSPKDRGLVEFRIRSKFDLKPPLIPEESLCLEVDADQWNTWKVKLSCLGRTRDCWPSIYNWLIRKKESCVAAARSPQEINLNYICALYQVTPYCSGSYFLESEEKGHFLNSGNLYQGGNLALSNICVEPIVLTLLRLLLPLWNQVLSIQGELHQIKLSLKILSWAWGGEVWALVWLLSLSVSDKPPEGVARICCWGIDFDSLGNFLNSNKHW